MRNRPIQGGGVSAVLAATAISTTYDAEGSLIIISWTPPETPEGGLLDSVKIFRTDGSGETLIYDDSVTPMGNQFSDDDWTEDDVPTYKIRYTFIFDAEYVSNVPPSAPTSVTGTDLGDYSIRVDWGHAATPVSFALYESISGGPLTTIATDLTDLTYTRIFGNGANIPGNYSYVVQASNGGLFVSGNSTPSDPLVVVQLEAKVEWTNEGPGDPEVLDLDGSTSTVGPGIIPITYQWAATDSTVNAAIDTPTASTCSINFDPDGPDAIPTGNYPMTLTVTDAIFNQSVKNFTVSWDGLEAIVL